ncbi:MAG: GTPase Era [Anaerolineae bacterium]
MSERDEREMVDIEQGDEFDGDMADAEDFDAYFDDEVDEGDLDADDFDGVALDAARFEAPEGFRSGFVAVIGRPNVGKSSLVNAYVGQKVAIVSPKPQTTRRRVMGVHTDANAQIVFVDTPGIHKPLHRLGEFMVDAAVAAIPDADVIVFVVDVSERLRDEDQDIARLLTEKSSAPIILALNKADRVHPKYLKENYAAYTALVPNAPEMLVSALRGDNLGDLLGMVEDALPEGPPFFPPDQVTDQSEAVMAAELIREAALHLTEEEVPHSLAVVIDEWEDRQREDQDRPGLTVISAVIYVERDSQKAIVIGRRGAMLKEIGARSRKEIEALLGRRVFLEIFVKVREHWRSNPTQLRRLGYSGE